MEAQCTQCKALFELNGETVPNTMICVCNGTDFKVLTPIEA